MFPLYLFHEMFNLLCYYIFVQVFQADIHLSAIDDGYFDYKNDPVSARKVYIISQVTSKIKIEF